MKEEYLFQELGFAGLGPKCLGYDSKSLVGNRFRIEEYISSRVLKSKEINQLEMRRKLAERLGQIHRLNIVDPDHLLTTGK